MKTIKAKLVLLISLLIIFALSFSGYFIIEQKTRELNQDIFDNGYDFANLTAPAIAGSYQNFYQQGSFIKFLGEFSRNFDLNNDTTNIIITDYQGNIGFNYIQEKDKAYTGSERIIEDNIRFTRIKDIKTSVE